MSLHNEIEFENDICNHLKTNGWYYSNNDSGYDVERALFPDDLIAWIQDTQPNAWNRLNEFHSTSTKKVFLDRVVKVLETEGTLHIFRKGFKVTGGGANGFSVVEFAPAHSFNQEINQKYAKNRIRVMRQVHYSLHNRKSIDLVIFVNGIPFSTLELKTDFTQAIDDAKNQYKTDRNPYDETSKKFEPLLRFKRGALVHFAVSTSEVWMTTKLEGMNTYFLPFNKGHNGGKGNPPNMKTYQTGYLWEEILQKDSLLNILKNFIQLEKKDIINKDGSQKTKETLIFPRYHQLSAVNKLIQTVKQEGVGKNYLFQHSAGSGKSNTISWCAHQLSTLHNDRNEKFFDSVIIITDRNVLDEQLKDTINQFSSTPGVVVSIDSISGSKSSKLVDALSKGAMIIVVTLQTFPFILKEIRQVSNLASKKFVVIADEAHSSQSGLSAGTLRKVLSSNLETNTNEEISIEDFLNHEITARALPPNISFLAFTATPKNKTLEMFGRKNENGLPEPFHLYTMKQAIQEGFILDVLQNFTPYRVAYKLAHNGKDWDDKEVDKSNATKTIARWVKIHPYNISQKVSIIVEHFKANVAWRLNGEAKAMVVTDSRQAAVRYKIEMDQYIKSQGYEKSLATLVAFSGDVVDKEVSLEKLNEKKMNTNLKGRGIREAFTTDEYQVLIVANKFQTGFDQPLLVAMYIDKSIDGIAAVQTLSRLNRTKSGKDITYILDFVNDADTIRLAFEPYYEHTSMLATTNPDVVYNIQTRLDSLKIYSKEEINQFIRAYSKKKATQKEIQAVLNIPVSRFKGLWKDAEEKEDNTQIETLNLFEKDLGSFCRLYEFLSQIVDYADTDLEARYLFYSHLAPLIKPENRRLSIDLVGVELTHYKLKIGQTTNIKLGSADEKETTLKPIEGINSIKIKDPEEIKLVDLLNKLNELFPDIDETDRINLFNHAKAKLLENSELKKQVKANSKEQFKKSEIGIQEMNQNLIKNMDNYQSMTIRLLNDEKLRNRFWDMIANAVYDELSS